MLTAHFIAKPPTDNGRVIAVARNHLAHLRETVCQDIGVWLVRHSLEGVPTPSGDFALQEDALPVAKIEDATILGPMDARESTIQKFQIVMIVDDPTFRLGHSEFWIAPRHALDAHQAHRLSVEVKGAVLDFELTHTKGSGQGVSFTAVRDEELNPVKIWTIEVPELWLRKGSRHRQSMASVRWNRKAANVGTDEDLESGAFLDDAKRCVPSPGFGGGIPAMRRDRKCRVASDGIRNGLDIELFHKRLGCDE